MQQNLTVVLKKQEPSIPAPNTGTLTDSNSFNSVSPSDLAGGVSVILVIALGICFIIYSARKNNLAKILTKIFTVTFLTTFILASIMSLNTFADNTENTNNTNNTNNTLSLTVKDFRLELEPTSEDTFAYGKSNIIVNQPTKRGYILSAYTTTPDLVHTGDTTQKINSLNSATKTVLTANTWGFSQSEPQDETSPVWQSLPTNSANALTLKDIDTATPAQDPTDVYLGINVNDKLALGEYKGTITYTVVAKPELAAYLDTGPTINAKMKNLANNTTDADFNTDDFLIKAFVKATHLPASFIPTEANTISTSTSPFPIYIFFDDTTGTMYYWTEADNVYLNTSASYMFSALQALEDISGVSSINTSQAIEMDRMFRRCFKLTDLSPLKNWDTSKAETLRGFFNGEIETSMTYTDISPLKDWDVSKVKDIAMMFKFAANLTNIDALKDWNTSSVTLMNGLFSRTNIANIDALKKWNISSVTDMHQMFQHATSLTNINGASGWNTSAVTNMSDMFSGASSLTNIDALSNWNTSSVTTMAYMFSGATSLTNIDGASKWNTSSVTTMANMFSGASSLTDIDGAAGWDTSSVTNISGMFRGVNNIDATVLNDWNVSSITSKTNAFTCPVDKRPSWY